MARFPLTLLKRFGAPLITTILFTSAILFLYHELQSFHYHEISRHFRHLPAHTILLALSLTLLSYLVLTGYDVLGIRAAGTTLAYPKTALSSFLGYSLSNNLGFSLVTGGAVRYRLLTGWGLTPAQVTNLLAFITLVFWLGFLSVCGVTLVCSPAVRFPLGLAKYPIEIKAVGVAMLSCVLVILSSIFRHKGELKMGSWHLTTPSLSLVFLGLGVAVFDWTLSASIAYLLIPHGGMIYANFVGLFLSAQAIGLVSNVPGGLGVFEAIMLGALGHRASRDTIVAGLVAFRLIYYLLPLALALISFLIYECLSERGIFHKTIGPVGRGVTALVPQIFALMIFGLGVILLFSGALPPLEKRYLYVARLVPLSVIELSHFSASLVGMALVLLAQGLRKRLGTAWYVTAVLLVTASVTSLLKGFDFEEAGLSIIILGLLLASKKHFYRKTSLVRDAFEPRWFFAVFAALISTTTLVFFAYKRIEYSHTLWWQYSFDSHASRTLRGLVGAMALLGMWGGYQLVKPYRPKPSLPTDEELREAQRLVSNSPRSSANLALVGDKALLFNLNRTAAITYAVQGRCAIVMGDPFGNADGYEEIVWAFLELCDEQGLLPAFYQVQPEFLPLYVDAGFSMIKLGQEALLPMQDFTLEGGKYRSFRQNKNRMEREGFSFEVISAASVSDYLPVLKQISDEWLLEKSTREKGFSLGHFDENYLGRLPVALVRRDQVPVAFANVWAGEQRDEFSVDLMRYKIGLHTGVMDYLFTELFLWGKAQGFKSFNLGMAPLSGMEGKELAPLWSRVGKLVFRYGEHFYNFQGVLQYKEKFHPIWEPRYLAFRGGMRLPFVLADVAALISRGVTGIIVK